MATSYLKIISFLLVLLFGGQIMAADRERSQSLDEQVETLKKEVISINRELFMLEEELLFPANTQTFFFLSMEGDSYFSLDSVELKVDGKVVSNYLYTDREVAALSKGPNGRDYRRGSSHRFAKEFEPKYIELKIIESQQKNQPEFVIKEWE